MDVLAGILLGCLPVVLFLAHLLGPLLVDAWFWIKWLGRGLWLLFRSGMHFTRPRRDRM
jgi:hypothetical protein